MRTATNRSEPWICLKCSAWMARVLHELPIGRTGLTANVSRQRGHQVPKALGNVRIHNWSGSSGVVRPRACSSRASSAIRSRTVPGLSNSSLHRRSDSISASNHAPSASCSLSGSFEASETAFSRSFSIAIHCTTRPRMRRLTPRVTSRSLQEQGCATGFLFSINHVRHPTRAPVTRSKGARRGCIRRPSLLGDASGFQACTLEA